MRGPLGVYFFKGTATFAPTRPVSVLATLTMPSVPAEKICAPSTLKARARQLPLCRRVRQAVSTVPYPGFVSVPDVEGGGRRLIWTWPEASPRAMREEVGWMAWAKSSEERG